MYIAIIIPVRNELQGLRELIEALLQQIRSGDEIVFVETGSTDGTAEMLEQYSTRHEAIRVVMAPGAMPGGARNAGIASTDCELIAQIDGANMPNAVWLDELRGPLEGDLADWVTGNSKIMPIPKSFIGIDFDLGAVYGACCYRGGPLRFSWGPEITPGEPQHFMAGGDSVAYRRSLWVASGGFPSWLRFGSDPLYVKKILQLKPRLAFAEKAVSYWQVGPGLRRVLERKARKQLTQYRTYSAIPRAWKDLSFQGILTMAMLGAIISPDLWPLLPGIYGILSIRQSGKSAKAYIHRTQRSLKKDSIALCCIMAIDFIGVGVQWYGTWKGLLTLPRRNKLWGRPVDAYLTERS